MEKIKCEVFGECGGCDLQNLSYEEQILHKQKQLLDLLAQHSIPAQKKLEIIQADRPWHYRHRIQLKGDGKKLGFFKKKSRQIINIKTCPIACDTINQTIPELRKIGKSKLRPFEVEIDAFAEKIHINWKKNSDDRVFHQINPEMNEKLKAWIFQNTPQDLPILDLFGGQANLSFQFIDSHPRIDCVDLCPAPEISQENFHFHQSTCLQWLEKNLITENTVIIMDPPRSGLGSHSKRIVELLSQSPIDSLFLIGCLAETWVLDLKRFFESQWKIKTLALFDFFPQTQHYESVAFLKKA